MPFSQIIPLSPSPPESKRLFYTSVSLLLSHIQGYRYHLCMKCSLGISFLSLLAILWNSAFRWVYLSFSPLLFAFLLFTAICKTSSDNHFAFLHFFFLGIVLITASCTISQTSFHSSSGTLSDLIP